jgi:alkanesulfonate monooxygenase SsuD/methylene tetrahydromethanopterin reductase-like flavin-dependent oxidoreductase (luciferase family)
LPLKFGFVIPGGRAKTVVNFAREAERAGWDGVFYYDSIWIEELPEVHSAWAILGAIAVNTSKIRIGSFLTAVARRNPWELAREAVTVDHLSGGRLIFPTGLGTLDDGGYSKVGLPTERRIRAEKLDEGLEILNGLWRGKPFSYQGKHFKFEKMAFKPRPIQEPRIPIWVIAAWGREKSMRRALKWDGIIPTKITSKGNFEKVTPDDVESIKDYVRTRRKQKGRFDIVIDQQISDKDWKNSREVIQPYADAGATWWTDALWNYSTLSKVEEKIKRGPPSL